MKESCIRKNCIVYLFNPFILDGGRELTRASSEEKKTNKRVGRVKWVPHQVNEIWK